MGKKGKEKERKKWSCCVRELDDGLYGKGGLLLREQDRKQLTHYQAVGNPMPTTLGREIITGTHNDPRVGSFSFFIIIYSVFSVSMFLFLSY